MAWKPVGSQPKPEWQYVTEDNEETTEVLRVSGGWLYRTTMWSRNADPVAVALAFQPERS